MALDKIGCVCSHRSAAVQLEARLGPLVEQPADSVVNLGIDFTAGRGLRTKAKGANKGRNAKLKARQVNFFRQSKRLNKQKSVLGRGCLNIFCSGPSAGVSYGAEVYGATDRELHVLRSKAMSTISPKSQHRSLTILSILEGDPVWGVSAAPIIRWRKEF